MNKYYVSLRIYYFRYLKSVSSCLNFYFFILYHLNTTTSKLTFSVYKEFIGLNGMAVC
jgi:hypothetical protein